MSEQSTATARFDWSLDVNCPKCEESIDLLKIEADNADYVIAQHIFSNDLDGLKGYEVTCPHCEHEFTLEKVEY